MIEKLRDLLWDNWIAIALYGGLFAVIAVALFWQLATLPGGYAPAEAASVSASNMPLTELLKNPLNAPYYLAVRGVSYVVSDALLATRLVGVGIGLAAAALFCWLLRQWHGPRTAILSTALFGFSAWFLHLARLGTPEVLALGLFALAVAGFWVRDKNNPLALLCMFLLVGALLYVPGMIWLLAVGALWQWRTLDRAFKEHLPVVSLGALLFLAALAPLGWAFYKDLGLLRAWAGVPEQLPTILEALKNVLQALLDLFIHHQADPVHWLGTVAMLDVFTVTMFALGLYRYVLRIKLVRVQLLGVMLLATLALIGLGDSWLLGVLLPFIYLVAANGINYMLQQWHNVFPRNPIAKGIGVGMMGLVVGMACFYNIWHYYVGWPQASATQHTFSIAKPKK